MLAYQYGVVEGLLRSDGCLAVLGCGLGLHAVLLELVRRVIADGGADARHATRLVFLLNTPPEEVELLVRRADSDPGWTGGRARLSTAGSEMGVEERAAAFALGGVFAVNARVLVPDLLAGRVVPEAVDGLIINHAHTIGELSAEAFVLRLCRSGSRYGFVRALSDRPDLFRQGQSQVDKIMQRCFVHNLEVWPRIRQEVQNSLLGPSQPEVCQRRLELPPRVSEIQRCILTILGGALDELRADPNIQLGSLGVNDSLFQSFEAELRQVLDPTWKSLGPRTHRMVHDLSGLQQLLSVLLRCDAVEFHALLESTYLASGERDMPAWVFSPEALVLFESAKARVYELPASHGEHTARGELPRINRMLEPHAKWDVLLGIIDRTIEEVAVARAAVLEVGGVNNTAASAPAVAIGTPSEEEQARDAAVAGSNDDVRGGSSSSSSDVEIVSVVRAAKRPRMAPSVMAHAATDDIIEPRLLVVVSDEKSKRQVSDVLHRGPEAYLLDALHSYLRDRCGHGSSGAAQRAGHPQAGPSSTLLAGGGGKGVLGRQPRAGEAVLLAREARAVAREIQELVPRSALQLRQLSDGRHCHPRVDVVAADGPDGSLEARLHDICPHAVVFYEPCLQAIRALEVFCADLSLRPSGFVKRELGADGQPTVTGGGSGNVERARPRAYLLVFDDSVEKHRFHQDLLRESEGMDVLIRARQHLTVRLDDGLAGGAHDTNAHASLGSHVAPPVDGKRSSRRGGGSRALDAALQRKVIVDMREFRSALPFMLYLRSMVVDPVTIPVGDYVLSRDICVERKAIPDLVQSLSSGRLYHQASNLCRYYLNPTLLIEFDPGKSFALQNTYTIARREVDVGARDLLGKLALVVLHFPKLRLLWSPSQRFTADVFAKLKEGRNEPDPKAAAQIDIEDPMVEEGASVVRPQSQGRAMQANSAALDVLRKLPGVPPRSVYALAKRAGCLAGVVGLTEQALAEIVGPSNAQQLLEFLRKEASTQTLFGHTDEAAAPS